MIIKANAQYIPLKSHSVQAIITSPPYYGLRDYEIEKTVFQDGWVGQLGQEPTVVQFISHLMQFMSECWRVLKDDGVCFINLGDTYIGGGMSGNSQVKMVRYAKTNKYPENSKSTVNGKRKSLLMVPERFALACFDAGWILRNKIIWHKLNGMPQSMQDRFTVKHEEVFMLVKQSKYYFNLDAVRIKVKIPPKPKNIKGKKTGNEKWKTVPGQRTNGFMRNGHSGYYDKNGNLLINPNGKNPGDVWVINTQPNKMAHFATFPEKLVERLLLCSTKTGDVVLDPFGGSGTVGKVALKYRRNPILIDLGYQNLQKNRIKEGLQPYLF